VAKAGAGAGSITDDRGKISCGADCSGAYDLDTPVVLTATPEPGNAFAGWSGACAGTGTCLVMTSAVLSVTATFNVDPCGGSSPPDATIEAPPAVCSLATVGAASVPDAGAGATYVWAITNGTITAGETTRTITFTAGATGTVGLDATVTVSGCAGHGTANIPVEQPPILPVVTTPAGAIEGETGLVASVPFTAGSTYAWVVTNGTITAGQGTHEITFTAGVPGTLELTVVETNAAGCASPAGSASIPVGPSGATAFHTLTPCRALDTRNGTGDDAAAPALEPDEVRTFDLTGRCGLPATARSLSVNFTVAGPESGGDLVAYRGDLGTPPVTSSISFAAGKTRANNGMLELSRDGAMTIKVHNRAGSPVDVILDVNGYFE
jgi:hypothetical protein